MCSLKINKSAAIAHYSVAPLIYALAPFTILNLTIPSLLLHGPFKSMPQHPDGLYFTPKGGKVSIW